MQILKTVGTFIKLNQTNIMTAVAVAGVITTAVLAAKNHPKMTEELPYAENRKEKVEIFVRSHWQTLISGGCTIGFIILAQAKNNRKAAILASAYAASETALGKYKDKVLELLGKEKADAFKQETAGPKELEDTSQNKIYKTMFGDDLFFDAESGRYFSGNIERLRRAENECNKEALNNDFAPLNMYYDIIGLESVRYGEDIGWTPNRKLDLIFTTKLTPDEKACVVVNYDTTLTDALMRNH
jgi:hypothetical protein